MNAGRALVAVEVAATARTSIATASRLAVERAPTAAAASTAGHPDALRHRAARAAADKQAAGRGGAAAGGRTIERAQGTGIDRNGAVGRNRAVDRTSAIASAHVSRQRIHDRRIDSRCVDHRRVSQRSVEQRHIDGEPRVFDARFERQSVGSSRHVHIAAVEPFCRDRVAPAAGVRAIDRAGSKRCDEAAPCGQSTATVARP